MLDLSQMKQLEAKATKGPWVAEERGGNPSGGMYEFEPGDRMVVGWEYMDDFADDHNDVAECWSWDNMQFIAASRTWIPDAIGEIELLQAVAVAAKEYREAERDAEKGVNTDGLSDDEAEEEIYKACVAIGKARGNLDTALAAWEKKA